MDWYGNTSYNVGDYPEPKDEEKVQPDYCPYCYRTYGSHVFKLDGLWACERCFEDDLKSNYDLSDIADALGVPCAKTEDIGNE